MQYLLPVLHRALNSFRRTDDNCWEYTGKTNNSGYCAIFCTELRRPVMVHRLSAHLFHKMPIETPRSTVVMHLCHNKRCFNPLHLRIGTDSENKRMDFARGARDKRGEKSSKSKLKNKAITQIRARYLKGERIIDIHQSYPNVDRSTISRIANQSTWSHI